MSLQDEFIKVAKTQIGVCEPSGDDKYLKAYNKLTGAKLSMTDSWCAAFVTWCAREAKVPVEVIPNFASCGSCISLAKANKQWHAGTSYKPAIGDLIFFDWLIGGKRDGVQDHVGIVVQVSNDYVTTIEGNTKGGAKIDGVREKKYARNSKDIFGYMSVKWPKTATEATVKFSTVKDVQKWLNDTSNLALAVDGIYGPKTRHALILSIERQLNKSYGAYMYYGGVWTSHVKRSWRNVSMGMKSQFVYFVQCGLICHGYGIELDGDFGDNTLKAVKDFQKSKGITVDGIVGKDTMTLLMM